MSKRSRSAPTSEEMVLEEAVVEPAEPNVRQSRVMMGFGMEHDGVFGYVVYELELPASIVERYCIRKHAPDIKNAAIARVENRMLRSLNQNGIKPTLSGNLLEDDE